MTRWSVIGLMGGLAAGTALALPGGGEELVTPLLLPAAGAAAGVVLGAAVGLASAGRRSRQSPRIAEPVPVAPREPDLTGLPAPPSLDGAVPEGWYTDPLDDSEQRWWDGAAWTGHVWRPRQRD
jgi:Protein of unknown function (DUF2510)